MSTKTAPPPPVPFDLFEAIVGALVVGISEAGLASCHGYNDREILAERFERAADNSLPESPHQDAMKSLLNAVADVVRNPEKKARRLALD